MRTFFFSLLAVAALSMPLAAQPATPPPAPDPWKPLLFLQGTWKADAQGHGGAAVSGDYTFRFDLNHHVLTRESHSSSTAKSSKTFDYQHSDLFTVYQDSPQEPLHAIYFDNESHVIHYDVTYPAATSAVFLSDPSRPGPRFRLSYELKNGIMNGKFEMQPPGQSAWTTYLAWSGSKK